MTAALFPYKKETGFACIQIKPVKIIACLWRKDRLSNLYIQEIS